MVGIIKSLVRFVSGVLVGVAFGYVLAQLLAPSDGGEMRHAFGGQSDALREGQRQLADAAQARIRRAVEEGRRAADAARAELEAQATRDRKPEGAEGTSGGAPL